MKIFALGDPHLSFGTDKPMNVFEGWDDHVERLRTNWEKTVSPEDVVVLVGDISWALRLEEAKEDFAFLDRLSGTKGNHDLWFSTVRKIETFFEENGFGSLNILYNSFFPAGEYGICGTRGWINEPGEEQNLKIIRREAGRLERSIAAASAAGKKPLVFLHYPPLSLKAECREILQVIERNGVKEVWYGHLHGQAHQYAVTGSYRGVEYRLVSCDYTGFAPVMVRETNI